MSKNKGGGIALGMLRLFSPKQADNQTLALTLVIGGAVALFIGLVLVGLNIHFSSLGLTKITGGSYTSDTNGWFTTTVVAEQGQITTLVGVGISFLITLVQFAAFVPGYVRQDTISKTLTVVGVLFLAIQVYDYATTAVFLIIGVKVDFSSLGGVLFTFVSYFVIITITGTFLSFGSEFWIVYGLMTIVINWPLVVLLFTGDEQKAREFAQDAAAIMSDKPREKKQRVSKPKPAQLPPDDFEEQFWVEP